MFRTWYRKPSRMQQGKGPSRRAPRTRLEVNLLETRTLPAVTFVPAAAVVPAVNRTDVAIGRFNNFEEPNLTINRS